LSEKGIKFKSAPRVVKDTGRRLTNIVDPEGNTLQIVD
jgi:hypothetical protein